MMELQRSLTFLTLSVFFLFLLGLVVFSWGKKLPGKGSWLIWTGFVIVLACMGIDSELFFKQDLKVKAWMAGWILPRDQISAITVGVYQDHLGLVMTLLSVLVAAVLLMNQSYFIRENRSERIYAATAISVCGVIFSWNSMTPWLGLCGVMLCVLGGFIAYGSRWDSNSEAKFATRFVFERTCGVVFSFLGACILLISRTALLFHQPQTWSASGSDQSTWIGATLLAGGLFLQMQPFPILGGLVARSELFSMARTLLLQIFPAWSAFALLVRLHSEFTSLGLFPSLGWVALGCAFLAVLSGLFQENWRQGLGIWLTSGFSLSIALLAFTGPMPSMAVLLGVSLGALSFSGAASALSEEPTETSSDSSSTSQLIWIKILLFLSVAAGTGIIGFVSATGGVRWIAHALEIGRGEVVLFLAVLFFYVLLGWKLAWSATHFEFVEDVPWASFVSLLICILLSLGMLWTGSVTGEVVLGDFGRIGYSLFNEFFGMVTSEIKEPELFLSASGLYWGALFVAFITSYWTSGRKEDQWNRLAKFAPKTSQFLAQGYGIDQVALRFLGGVRGLGRLTEDLVDFRLWNNIIPNGFSGAIKTITLFMNRIDSQVSVGIRSTLHQAVDVPAKFLQWIQVGDVRWYLLFALGSGFAILSHFLKL